MAPVQFRILGSLRVEVDGAEVPLTSPKQRSLLGALLVDVGSVVSTNRLAQILWGDDQPQDPSGAVQTHVSRLRSLLGGRAGAGDDEVLVTRPPGYELAVTPDEVDAGLFERLVQDARAAGSPESTGELLAEALALWRGPPLLEIDHEQARVEARRLQELRTTAIELRADALLATGRDVTVAGELESVVASHPFHEVLRGHLMVALHRSGRSAEALAAYRDLRDKLAGELGVEPSAPLRRLELAILQQDAPLPWPAPQAEPRHTREPGRPSERSPAARTAIPAEPLTSLVGRGDDIRGVTAALAERRIVVLTGPGGVGKSRLANRVARDLANDYADGVRLCELVEADGPAAVADVVATTLGVLPTEHDDATAAVVELLRVQRLLLVLDNCEHVIGAVGRLVDRIGRACPEVDVLATSRQPLGVTGQQLWPVTPLDIGDGTDGADAVELFRDRAVAADPSFELTDGNRATVIDICRRVDGLPLAVELAAARLRSMTAADVADRLDQRFDLLSSESADAPRHASLRSVVDWSVDLLADDTRLLFERLAVFAGGFGIGAAKQVCAGDGLAPGDVADRLVDLVDHSLVAVDRSGRHARYRLLETLRAHGWARLEQTGELPVRRRRQAEHVIALAEEGAAGLQGPEEARWVHVIDTEFANLRAAHAWACGQGEVDLALRLPNLLRAYGYYQLRDEVFDWVARALELPGAEQSPAWPAARVADGVGCMQRGQLEQAHAAAEEALAAGSDDVVLRAEQLLTEVALYRGHLEETDRRGRELIARARTVDHAHYESLGHLYRVYAATYDGRVEDAMAPLRAGTEVAAATGNPTLRAGFLHVQGEVQLDTDADAALAALRRTIELARSVGNRFIEGVARVSVASVEARHGEPATALADFRGIIDHWRTAGDWVHMWTTLHNLVVLLDRAGAHEPAAVLLGAIETATTGAPAFGSDAERLATTTDALRRSLGPDRLAEADARGRALTDAEAVAYALREIDRLVPATAPSTGR